LKFLIADDHALIRKGLVELLAAEYPQCQFVEAGNVPESIERVLHCELDLVVLDVSMPGGTGLDVLAAAAAQPGLPVLVVSMHGEDQYGPAAIRAGARGYLNKEAAPARLVEAVRTVLAGGRYFSSFLSECVAAEPAHPVPAPAAAAAPCPSGARVPLAPRACHPKRTGT